MARPTRLGAKDWTDTERDLLFDAYPPTGTHPTSDELAGVARATGRSPDAVGWMWEDANAAIDGRPSTASHALLEYLRGRGWLD